MNNRKFATIDGNEAASYVAYRTNEICAIYPITPSSPMAELADEWSSKGIKNIWGAVPSVVEMQSEGGAAGTLHGSLQAGALTTTFTASQGLLLKIPNMFKIAGELSPTVFHISARTVATHALSIFADHSDVMTARSTGFGMLSSSSVQEVLDFAFIAQAASLKSHIPFIHFFDGFRTSHEVSKVELIPDETMRAMIPEELVHEHRERALSPDHPVLRGTAQNPDTFFQNRIANNPYYQKCPGIVKKLMDEFHQKTGRKYELFEYNGHPEAEYVIVSMASSCETIQEAVDFLNSQGQKLGLVKVRLYRPFDVKSLIKSIPDTCKVIGVMDRTKEPGAPGQPLYLDVVNAYMEASHNGRSGKPIPRIINGVYGLSSKEFTPAMVKSVFENMALGSPRNHFTVGINDDVSNTSLDYDDKFNIESDKVVRGIFYGLGSDGTVGANKNSIKIIGENTDYHAQGYFVYDSKKSGSLTISHLRFGPDKIKAPYLISNANFVACHQAVFLEKYDMTEALVAGGTFLLNAPWPKEEVWDHLTNKAQQDIINKKCRFYTIDAQQVAERSRMGRRINTVMQTCFFAISGVFTKDKAIEAIKDSIVKTYGRKGEHIVQMNLNAVDNTLDNLFEVEVPNEVTSKKDFVNPIPKDAPEYVRDVVSKIIAGKGDDVPVSCFKADGTFPVDTAKYEKRNIALKIPEWDEDICIQCGKCALICPHSVIRINVFEEEQAKDAPKTFKYVDAREKEYSGLKYSIQVSPEDCTGCGVCVEICPVKNKTNVKLKALNMVDQPPLRIQEKENWEFFDSLPDFDRSKIKIDKIGQQQIQRPLFEFSGACSGCGETPYVKLMSQLFGDRSIIANATGCSSIYGGNLPTTPWTVNNQGRGPAWSNSLFEDNAEFGLGFRVAIDKHNENAKVLLKSMATQLGDDLVSDILAAEQKEEDEIFQQRERVSILKDKLHDIKSPEAARLLNIADYLVKKSVWIVGGDGWAYDIGYGGLDHVLSTGANVNMLVLDTEVYSNTGGQQSKATPTGAVAKFAASGKPGRKKDLGVMAMSYGNVYVATVAMGAKDLHTLKAFIEAEAYDGPSVIIAYSHCIAHGINMEKPLQNQKALIDSGAWILYRYNPDLAEQGKNPLMLDSKPKKLKVKDYMNMENRFKMLWKSRPDLAEKFYESAQQAADEKFKFLSHMAAQPYNGAASN